MVIEKTIFAHKPHYCKPFPLSRRSAVRNIFDAAQLALAVKNPTIQISADTKSSQWTSGRRYT
jgi:hypothetical protein